MDRKYGMTRLRVGLAWGALAACSGAAAEGPAQMYRISITGPVTELVHDCDDPCSIERIETVGRLGMQAEIGETEKRAERPVEDARGVCIRNCSSGGTGLKVRAPRDLKEGVEVTIEDRWAHFIFYSVTETESGPATKRNHYEFQIDRPAIELTLGEHDVEVVARVEDESRLGNRR